MSKIKQKLHSRSGASMLLAMVFMMFCTFVGGTVLAAAVANGNRVAQQTNEQQAYLNQRSALMVIADQLKQGADNGLQMTISFDYVDEDNPSSQKTSCNVASPTEFQELLCDLAENKFLIANNYTVTPLFFNGTIIITDHLKNQLKAQYELTDDYAFTIRFPDRGQQCLYLEPSVGSTESHRQEINSDGNIKTITTKPTTPTATTHSSVRRIDPTNDAYYCYDYLRHPAGGN